jgi:hypothetical protein
MQAPLQQQMPIHQPQPGMQMMQGQRGPNPS